MQSQQINQNIHLALLKMAKERKTLLSEPVFLTRKSGSKYATLILPDGTKQRKYLPRAKRCKGRTRAGRRCLKKSFSEFCSMHEDEPILPYKPQWPTCGATSEEKTEEKHDEKSEEKSEEQSEEEQEFPTVDRALLENSDVEDEVEDSKAEDSKAEEQENVPLPQAEPIIDEKAFSDYLQGVFRQFVLAQELRKQPAFTATPVSFPISSQPRRFANRFN